MAVSTFPTTHLRNTVHHPNWWSCPCKQPLPPTLGLPGPREPLVYSVSMNLTARGTSDKCNQTVFAILWDDLCFDIPVPSASWSQGLNLAKDDSKSRGHSQCPLSVHTTTGHLKNWIISLGASIFNKVSSSNQILSNGKYDWILLLRL